MKYAICNETFVDWPLERACDFAASCGYSGLEIAPFTLAADARQITPAMQAATRRAAAVAGLEVVGLHWLLAKTTGLHLTTRDSATRRRTAEYFADLARLVSRSGRLDSGVRFASAAKSGGEVSPAEGFGYAIEAFEQLAPVLEATRVTLALEPLGPSEGNFLNTAAEAETMIDALASPWIRLHLDCKAMASEQATIPEIIERHRRHLVHFHANDPNRRGPGMGELEFEPIMAALAKSDYHDWVSVEVFDYSPGPERLARESIHNLKAAAHAAGV